MKYRKWRDYDEREETDGDYGRESPTGSSWLSNASIASLLSESKIKATISALKAQITVLEAELLSRRLSRSHHNYTNWDDIGTLRGPEDGERLYPRVNRKDSKSRRRKSSTLPKIASIRATLKKLGVADVDALLQEWSKITGKEK